MTRWWVFAVTLILLLTGCSREPADSLDVFESSSSLAEESSREDSSAPDTSSLPQPVPAAASGAEKEQSAPDAAAPLEGEILSQGELEQIHLALEQMRSEGSLTVSWQRVEKSGSEIAWEVKQYVLLDAVQQGDYIVQVELYGNPLLDSQTMEETVKADDFTVEIQADERDPQAPFLAFGISNVTLASTKDGFVPIACQYQPYEQPGIRYLQERTRQLEPQLASSPKAVLDSCDPLLANYLWRQILSRRYVASPEEVTQWDLEHLLTEVELKYSTLVGDGTLPEDYLVDGEIFRKATGLTYFTSYLNLSDYSVFAQLDQLEAVHLYNDLSTDLAPDFSTLRIGHTKILSIQEFSQDFPLDLTDSQVDRLELQSYSAGITAFRGCEGITDLLIGSTRTDMRLINAQTFPDLVNLDLDIYSDVARFRDFSQLATFGEDVTITLSLGYQACNDDTLATLDGIPLAYLHLDPYNGPYPLGEPDPELLSRIPAEILDVVPAP